MPSSRTFHLFPGRGKPLRSGSVFRKLCSSNGWMRLSREGNVRGISPIIEAQALGIVAATLVALPVPEEKIRDAADIISQYPEVSHNFHRDHRYSLWFTLSAKDEATLHEILSEILERTGFSRDEILDLPTVRKIKIDVRFPLAGDRNGDLHGSM